MTEKVTTMVLKVDLQCPRSYKEVKKILCKFPEIRDQVYDEKKNTVKITVVCCSPEKIRSKLCRKGGKIINSIEIIEPKVSEPDKTPKPATVPKPDTPPPALVICCGSCHHGFPGGPCYHGCGKPPPLPPPPQAWYGCHCGCGGYRGCRVYCTEYFYEENPSACTIM